MTYRLHVNGQTHDVDVPGEMPLLWVLRDSLGNGGTVTYILGVRAGQMLELSLNADSQSIRFTVLRPGGQVLFDSAQGGAYYRGQTFENGDHRIRVYSTQPRAGAFSLNLSVF